jgi:hypothetical protein
MKTLIGGAIAVLLGIVGLAVWFGPFLNLLAGCIPPVLLLGGGLALYLGFDELTLINVISFNFPINSLISIISFLLAWGFHPFVSTPMA